jgi:hypothetical protein
MVTSLERTSGTVMAQRRSVRVAIYPPQVRIAGSFGRLVDVSETGALVQVQETLTSDRDWRLLISVDPEPVEVGVRVVRTQAVAVQLPEATWRRQEYAIGLAFTEISIKAREALQRLCGDAFGKEEVPDEPTRVSDPPSEDPDSSSLLEEV